MRLTHYGHACVVLEDPAQSGGRILIDPGNLAGDLDYVGQVDAVLITHEHPDHLDASRLEALRQRNPDLELFGSPGTPAAISPSERERVTVLQGEAVTSTVAGWDIVTSTATHATIYPALPDLTNNAYLVGGRIWHPGDAFVVPNQPVDVLLLPIGGPWLKLAEAIDYLRAVAPRVAIPIHQGGLTRAHRELHTQLVTRFAPNCTQVRTPEVGSTLDL